MNFKRIICFLLCITMVIGLSACAASSVPAGVDEEGSFVYAVVRSGEESIIEIENAAKELRAVLKANFDVSISYRKDTAYEDFDGNYEILVGNTNREESAEALTRLKDNRNNYASDFIIAVINDKICIQAIDSANVYAATTWFINTFCQSLESWAKLKTDYQFIYEHETGSISNTSNGADLGLYSVVLPRYASYLYGMVIEDFVSEYNECGYNIQSFEDIDPETEYEILIGDCDREVSKSVKVEGDNYVIKVIGNKIVIKGGNDLATNAAVTYFVEETGKGLGEGIGIAWSDGHTINGKYNAAEKGAYTLNWHDEFEASTLDYNMWGDYRNEVSGTAGTSCLGGNVYWQNVYDESLYKGSNLKDLIYTADGYLHMGTQKVTDKDFVGSQISTYWTMIYRYGLIEIRANLGDVPAATSLWNNGASTSGVDFEKRFGNQQRSAMTEMDILENYGKDDYFSSTLHKWWTIYDKNGKSISSGHSGLGGGKYDGNSKNNVRYNYDFERNGDDLTTEFHTWSCYWDKDSVKYAFDGKKFLDYQYSDNESVSIHCLMNYFIMRCRMGLSTYGTTYDPDVHTTYTETLVDYVRIYQSDSLNPQMITGWDQHKSDGTGKTFYPDNATGGIY